MRREQIFALLRFAFGCVWAVDAWLKWQPAFIASFTDVVSGAMAGQPGWIAAWIGLWTSIVSAHPYAWAIAVALAETAVAIGLLFGFLTRIALGGGIVLALIIWTVPEGFGGPYVAGMPDVGAAIIYVFVMLALWAGACWERYSVDAWLAKQWDSPLWSSASNAASADTKRDTPVQLLMFAVVILGAIIFIMLPAPSAAPSGSMSMGMASSTVVGPGATAPMGMMLKTYEVPPGYPTPTVDFTITRDPVAMGGWDVHITTTNFTFTPQNVNGAPVPDEGHVHLYVDDTLYVLYGPWYHLDDIPPGTHTITVALAANDHSIYTKNGQNIQKQQTITQ